MDSSHTDPTSDDTVLELDLSTHTPPATEAAVEPTSRQPDQCESATAELPPASSRQESPTPAKRGPPVLIQSRTGFGIHPSDSDRDLGDIMHQFNVPPQPDPTTKGNWDDRPYDTGLGGHEHLRFSGGTQDPGDHPYLSTFKPPYYNGNQFQRRPGHVGQWRDQGTSPLSLPADLTKRQSRCHHHTTHDSIPP